MRLKAVWQRRFLGLEAAAATAPALALIAFFGWFDGAAQIDELLQDQRGVFYRTLATVSGTLLGFSLASASLVLTFVSSDRLALLRRSAHYGSLWKVFFQCIRSLGLLTVLSLAAIVIDRDEESFVWILVPMVGLVTFVSLRLLRVIWILEQIVRLVSMAPRSGRANDSPPEDQGR